MSDTFTIRPATPADADAFVSLVNGLADFEKLTPPDEEAKRRLIEDGLGPNHRLDVLIAEVAGEAAGYAVIFESYSTFLARPKLFLEDLFVHPDHRGSGIGEALIRACAREALSRGCTRMEWVVLDWNARAINFYKRLGAEHASEWLNYCLDTEQLTRLAQ